MKAGARAVVECILRNEARSTDAELVEWFIMCYGLTETETQAMVAQRGEYLNVKPVKEGGERNG